MQKVFVILLISLSTCLSKATEPAIAQDVAKAPVQEPTKTEVPVSPTATTIVDNKVADPSIKPSATPLQKTNVTDATIIHENASLAIPTNQTATKSEPDNKTTDKKEESAKGNVKNEASSTTEGKKEESHNTTVIPAAKEETPKSEGVPVPQPTKPKVLVPTKSEESAKNGTTTTTIAPKSDGEKPVLQARGFDGPSFIGGIILTLGLLAVSYMGFKYYKNQTERNYHTL